MPDVPSDSDSDLPNGLSLSGKWRLQRIEQSLERNTEMLGGLGNKVDRNTSDVERLSRDFGDFKREVRDDRRLHNDIHKEHEGRHDDDRDVRNKMLGRIGFIVGLAGGAAWLIDRAGGL